MPADALRTAHERANVPRITDRPATPACISARWTPPRIGPHTANTAQAALLIERTDHRRTTTSRTPRTPTSLVCCSRQQTSSSRTCVLTDSSLHSCASLPLQRHVKKVNSPVCVVASRSSRKQRRLSCGHQLAVVDRL